MSFSWASVICCLIWPSLTIWVITASNLIAFSAWATFSVPYLSLALLSRNCFSISSALAICCLCWRCSLISSSFFLLSSSSSSIFKIFLGFLGQVNFLFLLFLRFLILFFPWFFLGFLRQ